MRRIEALAADAGTLQVYLREIAKFPRLELEQERELGRRIQQRGDDDALHALVESNLRFVVSYAKRYRTLGVPLLELIHEGNVGLIEAARRFDPERNTQFISYGAWWVRQSIMHRLSESRDILMRNHVWLYGGVGNGVELAESLRDEGRQQIEDEPTRRALVSDLEIALKELDARERQVMRLRYGLHDADPWTVPRVGRQLRLRRERVRRIEARAVEKLRRRKLLRCHLN